MNYGGEKMLESLATADCVNHQFQGTHCWQNFTSHFFWTNRTKKQILEDRDHSNSDFDAIFCFVGLTV